MLSVMEETRVHGKKAILNVQRAVTPKLGKPELRCMSSAHCLMVLYICVKFRENIRNGISYGADMNHEALRDGQMDIPTDRRIF